MGSTSQGKDLGIGKYFTDGLETLAMNLTDLFFYANYPFKCQACIHIYRYRTQTSYHSIAHYVAQGFIHLDYQSMRASVLESINTVGCVWSAKSPICLLLFILKTLEYQENRNTHPPLKRNYPLCPHGPIFTKNRLTLVPAWINNNTHYKVCDEITYLFPNLNSAAWKFGNGWVISSHTGYVITHPCWDQS